MGRFRVWAPRARRVDVVIAGHERRAMTQAGGGWWEAPGADPGVRYAFSLDSNEPRPDPRSNFQPDGVLGASQVVDHSSHRWRDAGWGGAGLAGQVLYELHVGTFTPPGTFDAVVERLPYLVDLGVSAVEIMPVAEFGGDHGWGYDGAALYAPHHAYGGPDGLKRLVDACHEAGLAAVLDVVYNHLGPVGNFLAEFGPYYTERYRTPWGAAINYDGRGSDEVRRFVVDNAVMWIRDYHFDGLRLDAVHAILDQSPVHILEQLAGEVRAAGEALGRRTFVVAESDTNDPRLVWPVERGGYGLDGVWSDDWHHAVHALVTGERYGYYRDFGTTEGLTKALRQAWVYDGAWSEHRGRTKGRPAPGVPSDRFVIALQNHDQVGNRAQGDRLRAPLEAISALLLTSQFTPMLFQGEEWAASTPFLYFTDFDDPQLARAVRDGRREEFEAFGWDAAQMSDPNDPETFERSRLDWAELDEPAHRAMLDWYRKLIALRRRLPVWTRAVGEDVDVRIDESGTVHFHRAGVTVRVDTRDWSVDVREEHGDRVGD
jgi:maltooligosyltrehalose trehalohydrolase